MLLLAATGTSVVLMGFADATLDDVLESITVHQRYYQAFSWYREFIPYQTILRFQDSSQWARRAPVVLTVAVLLIVALASRFGSGAARQNSVHRLLLSSAACSAIALVLLTPTPHQVHQPFRSGGSRAHRPPRRSPAAITAAVVDRRSAGVLMRSRLSRRRRCW